MNHSFDTELAKLYGIEEAILIENLAFWTKKNIANKSNYHDGRYWVYNSARAFEELFTYMNKTKISRVLKNLETLGVLVSGNYNKNSYDRTKWYSIVGKLVITKYNLPLFNMQNGCKQNDLTIPIINTAINTGINNTLIQSQLNDSFEIFWKQYNKKKAKKKCLAKWKRISPKDRVKIFDVLPSYLKMESDIKFRPHPLTFLNGELWNDEIIVENKLGQNGKPFEKPKTKCIVGFERGKAIYEK